MIAVDLFLIDDVDETDDITERRGDFRLVRSCMKKVRMRASQF